MSDARTKRLNESQNPVTNYGIADDLHKLVLPQNTTTNLADIPNQVGSIAYDNTLNTVVINDGTGFNMVVPPATPSANQQLSNLSGTVAMNLAMSTPSPLVITQQPGFGCSYESFNNGTSTSRIGIDGAGMDGLVPNSLLLTIDGTSKSIVFATNDIPRMHVQDARVFSTVDLGTSTVNMTDSINQSWDGTGAGLLANSVLITDAVFYPMYLGSTDVPLGNTTTGSVPVVLQTGAILEPTSLQQSNSLEIKTGDNAGLGDAGQTTIYGGSVTNAASTGNAGSVILVGGTNAGSGAVGQVWSQSPTTIGQGTSQQHTLNTTLATAASDTLTLTNGPTGTAGNPAGYISININGTPRVIPFW